jgi:indolepyruvate ferredoxin oxidoreductase beta subunit
MALMPTPGDVDVVVAAEAVEAARAVARGFVTPDRTVLVASTHRVYTIAEKSALGDGRADTGGLAAEVERSARRFINFDMARIAERNGAVISAVLLGAIAGAGALPFDEDAYRAAIRATGKSVDANLAAFDAGAAAARAAAGATAAARRQAGDAVPGARGSGLQASPMVERLAAPLASRIETFPDILRPLLRLAAARLIDYQDLAYAAQYLDRVEGLMRCEPDPAGELRLASGVARHLAVWMSFEDTIRVADLKTRSDRAMRIRAAIRVRPDQVLAVTEFMKPRVEEICGTLPAWLGRWLPASPARRRLLERFTGDRTIRTSSVSGFALLRAIAGLRRWRRGTLRYQVEDGRIRDWLGQLAALAGRDYELAVEVAANQALIKGYGDTHARGWRSFTRLGEAAARLEGQPGGGRARRRLREAALADEHGRALDRALTELGRAAA